MCAQWWRPPTPPGAPLPSHGTEWMLRSLWTATSAPVRLHLLATEAGTAGLDTLMDVSRDAWEAVELVSVSDETLAAAAEAVLPGLAGGRWRHYSCLDCSRWNGEPSVAAGGGVRPELLTIDGSRRGKSWVGGRARARDGTVSHAAGHMASILG